MIRRAFIRALSGAILTTLLGVKAWRLEASEAEEWVRISDLGAVRPLVDSGARESWHLYGPGVDRRGEGSPPRFDGLEPGSTYVFRYTYRELRP